MKRKNHPRKTKQQTSKKVKQDKQSLLENHNMIDDRMELDDHNERVKIILSDLFDSNDENQQRLRKKFNLQSKGKVKWLMNRTDVNCELPIEFSRDKEYVLKFLDMKYDHFSSLLKDYWNSIHKDLLCDLDVLYSLMRFQENDSDIMTIFESNQDLVESLVTKFGVSVILRCPNLLGNHPEYLIRFFMDFLNTDKVLASLEKLYSPKSVRIFFGNNREVLRKLIGKNGVRLDYLSDDLLDDADFIYELCLKAGCNVEVSRVSERLRNDGDFMSKMVKISVHYLHSACTNLRSDSEFMLKAIKENFKAITYVKKELLSDITFLKQLVNLSAKSLAIIDPLKRELALTIRKETLRMAKEESGNKERMLDLCIFSPLLLKQASEKLLMDKDFIIEYFEIRKKIFGPWNSKPVDLSWLKDLECVNNMKKDGEYMIALILIDPHTFQLADTTLQHDNSFILMSLQAGKKTAKYIPKELLEDREFSMKCLNISGRIFKHLPIRFRDENEFVRLAVKQHFKNIQHASIRLREDKNFLISLHKESIDVLYGISDSLSNDRNFLLDLIEINCAGEGIHSFLYAHKYCRNEEFVIEAMKRNKSFSVFDMVTNNRRIALEVVKLGLDLGYFEFDDAILEDEGIQRETTKYSGVHKGFSQDLFDLRMEYAYNGCKI